MLWKNICKGTGENRSQEPRRAAEGCMAVLALESLSPWQSRPGCKPSVCHTSAPDYLCSQGQSLTLSDLSSLLYNKLPGPESRAPPALTSRRPQLALTPGHGSFLFVGLLRLHLQSLILFHLQPVHPHMLPREAGALTLWVTLIPVSEIRLPESTFLISRAWDQEQETRVQVWMLRPTQNELRHTPYPGSQVLCLDKINSIFARTLTAW